ncbi:hypothetical protein CHUAL_013054 [Chamberlinius hualienensis]
MAALEILGNGESGTVVTEENIAKTVELLEDPLQKNFIWQCLRSEPLERPSARELLFHPILFEVHSLKLLSAHVVNANSRYVPDILTDEGVMAHYGADVVIAEIKYRDERPPVEMRASDLKVTEKLEKFMEDVRNGIYPLTAFGLPQPPQSRPRAISPEVAESVASETPEPVDVETRKVIYMMCSLKPRDDGPGLWMTILLRMEDKMNRQLTCEVAETDSSTVLAEELVHFGFISEVDREKMATLIEDALQRRYYPEESRPLQVMVSHQVQNQQVVSQAVLPPPAAMTTSSQQWTVSFSITLSNVAFRK